MSHYRHSTGASPAFNGSDKAPQGARSAGFPCRKLTMGRAQMIWIEQAEGPALACAQILCSHPLIASEIGLSSPSLSENFLIKEKVHSHMPG